MQYNIKQYDNLSFKGFVGTVFYSELYHNFFGWVKGVEGLLYYEYDNLNMLKYSFRKVIDEYLECKEFVPHGYTNTEYLFFQLTKDKTYEELTEREQNVFDQSIGRYWDWNSVIETAREKAKKTGEDYRYMRSIAEIHDSAFEVGRITASSHIAERMLAKGFDSETVKDVCGLTDQHLNAICKDK